MSNRVKMLKGKLLQSLPNKIQKLKFSFFLRVLLCFSLLVSAVGTNTAWADGDNTTYNM
jgi:hypothetical protein